MNEITLNTSKPAILIVDDDEEFTDSLADLLSMHSYQVVTKNSVENALTVLEEKQIDMIISDLGLPEQNGYQFFEQILDHPQWCSIPFVLISARNFDSDILYGKSLGVDDYIPKPVDSTYLLEVIKGKIRRFRRLMGAVSQLHSSDVLKVGNYYFNDIWQQLEVGDVKVSFGQKEYALLKFLAKNQNKPITSIELATISHQTSNIDHSEASNLVRSLIRNIRRKLKEHGLSDPIKTIRNIGYCFLLADQTPPSS